MGPEKMPEKKLYVQDDSGTWYEVKYDKAKVLQAVHDSYSEDIYERFKDWLNDPDDTSDFDVDIYLNDEILAELISPDDPVTDLS